MRAQQVIIVLLGFLNVQARAQSLIEALQAKGLTEYANLLKGTKVLDAAGPNLIVYAASNEGIARSKNNNPAQARRAEPKNTNDPRMSGACVDALAEPPMPPTNGSVGGSLLRVREQQREGSVYSTLLNDPEFVNLGPGRNQTLVERRELSPDSSQRVVCTGLGATINVVGSDIKFDRGVIRPVNGLITLPQSLSLTLPFLGANGFRDALQKVNLLEKLDNRASTTVLAPNDAAWKSTSGFTDDQLVNVVKQHIVVDFPAYTPLLTDGYIYRTLAGTNVTVYVRNGIVYFNDARISAGDSIIKNGVVHTLDKALISASSTSPQPSAVPTAASAKLVSLPWSVMALVLVGMVLAAHHQT